MDDGPTPLFPLTTARHDAQTSDPTGENGARARYHRACLDVAPPQDSTQSARQPSLRAGPSPAVRCSSFLSGSRTRYFLCELLM